jgi:hypothetical protein
MPRKRRPASLAASSVDPEPQNGSRTRPPGRENESMSGVNTHTGYCVGCSRLPGCFHAMTSGMQTAGGRGLPLRSRYAFSR